MLNQSITVTQALEVNQRRWLIILILMLMSTAGLVGSDVYLPTLPEIGNALHRNHESMQYTLGVYLLGLAIGQLLLGPITDCFGRRRLLLSGMLLYCLTSLLCAISVSYYQLLLARFMQAIGACTGLIIGRAIVGDIFDKHEAGKVFATIFPFVGMSPAISPLIGGLISYYYSWHATFIFIALFALLIVGLVFFYLPETLVIEHRQLFSFKKILSIYLRLLSHKKFISYVLTPCVAYIAYFAYLAQSPFIFYSNGFNERVIGTFYITLSLTYVLGNVIAKRLLNTYDLNYLLKIGFIIFNIGGFFLFITGLFHLPLFYMVIAISFLTIGNGFLIPLGTAGVIGACAKQAGTASGLLGFLQLSAAAISSSMIGWVSENSILKLGIFTLFITIMSAILFWYLEEE